MDDTAHRRVLLNALLAQTNGKQGPHTSRTVLKTITVAHGSLTPAKFEETLAAALESGEVVEEAAGWRPADTLTRIPHPGELSD